MGTRIYTATIITSVFAIYRQLPSQRDTIMRFSRIPMHSIRATFAILGSVILFSSFAAGGDSIADLPKKAIEARCLARIRSFSRPKC